MQNTNESLSQNNVFMFFAFTSLISINDFVIYIKIIYVQTE